MEGGHIGSAASDETLDGEKTSREAEAAVPRVAGRLEEIGRYVVLRTLGAGAMGTVFLAYDPELDRKIALKLLHGDTSPTQRRALLMEAQAMAKLSHPNVVGVHDVGERDSAVYVAMEFVEGTTLRRWLEAEPRRWRDVVEKFVAAAHGLAAAHQRGLIHRDFKPDNVMVSDDGQVRVMDFGLARPSGTVEQTGDVESISGSVLTVATLGRVAGTPAYMAPEQSVASTLTPAVDQFAFCVSLWEGICGERPFAGPTYPEQLRNISEGRVRPPPANRRMPRWLERTLLRGLRADEALRWPSMEALIDALERGRRRWRWQVGLAAVGLAAVPIALVTAERERRAAACEAEGAAILDVWSDDARQRLRSGLLATGVPFANDSADTLIPWLDAYAQTWRDGRAEACTHETILEDWSPELSDRAMWCFEDRRLQLEATVDQISRGDMKAARRAVRLASYLDPVESCLNEEFLERLPVPPMEIRDAIRDVRARLIDVDRLRHAGRYDEAMAEAREARARAEALDWPPLHASARLLEGRSLLEAGRSEEATAILTNTYFEAEEAGSLEVAFRAARALVFANSTLERFREAEVWARHADALAQKKSDPGRLDEAEGHYLLMDVRRGLGELESAAEHGERALALRTATLGAEHPITAAALRNLGVVYLDQGRDEEALAMFEQADAIWRAAVGRRHPHVGALALLNGRALVSQGRIDEATGQFEEGVDILEQTLAPEHPKMVAALADLAGVYLASGRLDDAAERSNRARAIALEHAGPRSSMFAGTLLDAMDLARARGDLDEALKLGARALEIRELSLDPSHPDLLEARDRIAGLHADRGELEEAVALRLGSVEVVEAAHGEHDRRLVDLLVALADAQRGAGLRDDAWQTSTRAVALAKATAGEREGSIAVLPLCALAEVELDEGRAAEALRLARRAVRIARGQDHAPRRVGRAAFVLARALAASGTSGAEPRAAALRAKEAFATMHATHDVRRVDAWLEAFEARAP